MEFRRVLFRSAETAPPIEGNPVTRGRGLLRPRRRLFGGAGRREGRSGPGAQMVQPGGDGGNATGAGRPRFRCSRHDRRADRGGTAPCTRLDGRRGDEEGGLNARKPGCRKGVLESSAQIGRAAGWERGGKYVLLL